MRKCRNANEVFPPELVREIQKHFAGGVLWIPVNYTVRNQEICRLREKGVTPVRIAERFGLSLNRVWEILKKDSTRYN